MAVRVAADLEVRLQRGAGDPGGEGDVVLHLRGHDSRLTLEVSDPAAFAGSADAPAVRAFAESLAATGVVVRVVHDGQLLVCLGAVRAPWWQRRATGSARIRLGSLRGAVTSARARARRAPAVLPSASLLPPTTMWPIAPTFARRSRRRVTGTHDPARGGSARLVLVREDVWGGERQPIFWLGDGVTIGSDPTCDVVLRGLAPLHARVEHDEEDEYVVRAVDGDVRVHGARVLGSVLRSGARVDLGPHHLAYYREEHADHGRPYYGRIGGELGRQRPQPPDDRPAV